MAGVLLFESRRAQHRPLGNVWGRGGYFGHAILVLYETIPPPQATGAKASFPGIPPAGRTRIPATPLRDPRGDHADDSPSSSKESGDPFPAESDRRTSNQSPPHIDHMAEPTAITVPIVGLSQPGDSPPPTKYLPNDHNPRKGDPPMRSIRSLEITRRRTNARSPPKVERARIQL